MDTSAITAALGGFCISPVQGQHFQLYGEQLTAAVEAAHQDGIEKENELSPPEALVYFCEALMHWSSVARLQAPATLWAIQSTAWIGRSRCVGRYLQLVWLMSIQRRNALRAYERITGRPQCSAMAVELPQNFDLQAHANALATYCEQLPKYVKEVLETGDPHNRFPQLMSEIGYHIELLEEATGKSWCRA
eukprot:jgi/Botrbrau1/19258/Bobra.0073s0008.1